MEAMLTSGRQAGYKLGTTRNRSDPGLCPKHTNNSYKPRGVLCRVRPTEQGADERAATAMPAH